MEKLEHELKRRLLVLGPNVAFRIERHSHGATEVIDHQGESTYEVGSCFKAFVAAELCRQVDAGMLSWNDEIIVRQEERVPSSSRLDAIPDGSTVTLEEAARAMIAVSDNTATDLVLARVGHERVTELMERTGMERTSIPESVKRVYATEEGAIPIACRSTMTDLTRFYTTALTGTMFRNVATLDRFKDLLREEDRDQGTTWRDGVLCYRKSGSLEPPPLFVQAMAGAFIDETGMSVFAFVVNQYDRSDSDDTEALTAFVDALRTAMRTLAGME